MWNRRIGLVLVVGYVLAGGAAYGQMPLEGGDEVTQPVLQALEVSKLSEALKLGQEACTANPNHAGAHALYGYTLIEVARLPEAVEQLEKAVALAPDDKDVAVRLGYLHWELDNPARAREVAAQALRRWPDDPVVGDLDFTLQTDDRIRTGKRETYEPGSVHRFVDEFCQEVATAGVGQAVVDRVDPAVLATIMGQARIGGSEAEKKRKLIGKLEKAWNAALSDHRDTYLGFEVAPRVEERDGGAQGVSVNVLAKRWIMQQELASIRNFLRHPDQPGLVAPEVRQTLAGLEPADQQRYVDALGSRATMEFVHVEFTVADQGQGWRVEDVVVDGRMSLSNIGGWVNLMDRSDSDSSGTSTDVAYSAGRLVGIALIFGLISLLVRWGKRRFAGGGSRRPPGGGPLPPDSGSRPMGR